VGVAQLEGLLRAVLGACLHEVELAVVELQVGTEGLEQVPGDLVALVSLRLLDEGEAGDAGLGIAFHQHAAVTHRCVLSLGHCSAVPFAGAVARSGL